MSHFFTRRWGLPATLIHWLRTNRFSHTLARISALAVVLVLVAPSIPARASSSGTWSSTGSMSVGRALHVAVTLSNGTVLVAGGRDSTGSTTATAEVYDPTSGTWSLTGSMSTPRDSFTATRLNNGLVLAAGGHNSSTWNLATAELYDPATGLWRPTGSMNQARNSMPAVLLADGQVLVAGGNAEADVTASAELYDPATGTWSATGSMTTARFGGQEMLTLLPGGQVLVAGGMTCCPYQALADSELYDPSTQTWSVTGSLNVARGSQGSVALAKGFVLNAGGWTGIQTSLQSIRTTEIFDPQTNTWRRNRAMGTNRMRFTLTRLPNGLVLAAAGDGGGWGVDTPLASAELYDPVAHIWTPTGSLATARFFHTATLLSTGQVLVAGGTTGTSGYPGLTSAELYTP